jgi:hypothetical protein
VPSDSWFPEALGELAEEVIGLERYGKTLTVLYRGDWLPVDDGGQHPSPQFKASLSLTPRSSSADLDRPEAFTLELNYPSGFRDRGGMIPHQLQ